MKILVTGCSGYIGSVVTEKLLNKGHEVIGIDNFHSSKPVKLLGDIKFYEGSFGDPVILDEIFASARIDVVFHFGAETTIDFCMTDPSSYFRNNVSNGLVLLDKMNQYECKKMIFSSTAAIFGEPVRIPIDESHPTIPINSYGESKLMFEKVLEWYNYAYSLQYNIFRYFNAAGATAENGENRLHETHLLPIVLMNVIDPKFSIKVFGNDYPTKDGTCIRDYVHVEDIAEGHLLAIDNLSKNPKGKYNLGSGSGYSIMEVIDTVNKVTGKNVKYSLVERREGDPAVLVASNELAKRELKWEPSKSNLETIVRDSYLWLKKLKG